MSIAEKTAIATLVFGYCHTGVSLTDENSVSITMVFRRPKWAQMKGNFVEMVLSPIRIDEVGGFY